MSDEPELYFFINGDIKIMLRRRNQDQQQRWEHIKKVLDNYFRDSEFSSVTDSTESKKE